MRVASRSSMVCVLGCLAGPLWLSAVASAEELSSPGGPSSLSGSSLVVGGEEPLVGGQQVAAEEAKLANPEAVALREESAAKFEGLSATQSALVDHEAFPSLIDDPSGGPPRLPEGDELTGFANAYVAQANLGSDYRGLVQSSAPMAIQEASGGWAPVDLHLHDTGGAIEPANPLVAVRLPKRSLSEGAQLPGLGMSVTPADAQGSPLAGVEGSLDGASVLFTDALTDTDAVLKPSSFGFAIDMLLRSVKSPEQLVFRVGLPAGASLVEAGDGSGVVRVVKEGVTVASVPPPSAHDAAGTFVPVSMRVAGDLITLTVPHQSGSVLFPVDVDPEFNEATESLSTKNWFFKEATGGKFIVKSTSGELAMIHEGPFPANNWANAGMETKGESKIYEFTIEEDDLWAKYIGEHFEGTEPYVEAWIEIHKEGTEAPRQTLISGSPYLKFASVCANAECSPAGGVEKNLAGLSINTSESSRALEENKHYELVPYGAAMSKSTTYISQPKELHSTVSFNTASSKVSGTINALYGSNNWLSAHQGAFEYTGHDLGTGVSGTYFEQYGSAWELFASKSFLETAGCTGIQCAAEQTEALSYESKVGPYTLGTYLHNGENKLRISPHDAASGTAAGEHGEGEITLKVDTTVPHSIALSGLTLKGEEYELGEAEAHLKLQATDGEGSVPSSGIKSLEFEVDEHKVGVATGSCTPGPCTATGEWAINGAELGTGRHVLQAVATDNAGNLATKEFIVKVYHASPVALGPGSVNPESGDFAMEATDVSMSGGMGDLLVSRHYDSRNLKEGVEGPLGAQWSIVLGSLASLEVLPDGSLMLIGPEGLVHFSKKSGGGFESPVGDSSLTLGGVEKEGHISEYLLKNAAKGTTTRFTLPSGAKAWMPTVSEGPIAADTVTDAYTTAEPEAGKKIVEPTLEVAPHPSATCVVKKLEKGCRALEFDYAESTTATGESKFEWGNYKGHLTSVYFIAWDPSSKTMKEVQVARYLYDKQGRLRAEWDPRISPALETTYGYDGEGHITAVSPPGGQPWLLAYGTTSGDVSAGRLLSITRPASSTELGGSTGPTNTTAPALSSSETAAGVMVSVSNGSWSNSPLAYSYQWSECNILGFECLPISGATNQTYTPTSSNVGVTLRAEVRAANGIATSAANSSVSKVVLVALPPVYSSQFGSKGTGNGQFETNFFGLGGLGMWDAVDSSGHLWVTDPGNNRVQEFSSSGGYLSQFGTVGTGNGQFKEPTGIAIDSEGHLLVVDKGNDRVQVFSTSGEYIRQFGTAGTGNGQFKNPEGITVDPKGHILVVDSGNGRVEMFSSSGEYLTKAGTAGTGYSEFKRPGGIAVANTFAGLVAFIADSENNRVQMLYDGASSLSFAGHFGSAGTGNGQFSEPRGIAFDSSGRMWVSDAANDRIEVFSPTFEYLTKFGGLGKENGQFKYEEGLAFDKSGHLWVADSINYRVQQLMVPPISEGPPAPPNPGTSAVTTVEYKVPVTGAPYKMGATEVLSGWGQTDAPTEATAIFPPDEPMGWPAQDYRRATVYYMDSQARTVNVASPSGAISTSEYSSNNNVVRTLSAANREMALKEGAKSAEVAKLLDTESVYAEEGTRLTETLGPQHTVKIVKGNAKVPGGSETLVRNHVKYYYDEGAPSGGESYDLVTKTTDGAQTASKEEFDMRTALTSYSGQSNLGWKLREPTSTVTNPEGLKLTHTTFYSEATGNVTETRAAGGEYTFGFSGTGEGQLSGPKDTATSAAGNVYVCDSGNNRIEEFTAEGAFVRAWGSYGTGNGQFRQPEGIAIDSKGNVWVSDKTNARIQVFTPEGVFVKGFGSEGSGSGQMQAPGGIAIDSKGNVWVADIGNNRVDEFNAEGTFVQAITTFESGKGTMWSPQGVAIDASGDVWVADTNDNRILEFTATGEFLRKFGSAGSGNGQFSIPRRLSIGPDGNVWVSDSNNSRVEVFTPSGEYKEQFGGVSYSEAEGKFYVVEGLAFHGSTVYVVDDGDDRVEKWTRSSTGTTLDNKSPHDTQIVYYTPGTEASVGVCQNHPEWANLPCQAGPVAQPETSGLPPLPVITTTYDVWDQPESITEAFGSTTRTKKTSFDLAGRALTSEVSSSTDTPVPTVTDQYSTTTGALVKQSETVEGKEKSISSAYNTLGQLEIYTDADGGSTAYAYDIDGRVTETTVSGGGEQKGKQTYAYDPTSGFLTKLVDSAAGTFTASYDVAGRMTSETYPNNMTAYYTHNTAGETTGVEYKKNAHCSTTCPEIWFDDTIVPSVHGETIKQSSNLAEEPNDVYDEAGRLTEVQEIPAGKGCKTRLYTYDIESNRMSLVNREPGSEGKCATEGGTSEKHVYDEANRLVDTGVAYDTFGNTTTLPAADSGSGEVTSSYYVDNELASQTQNSKTYKYYMDPAGRLRETKTETGGKTVAEVTSHYSGPGSALTWTSEEGGKKWSRNIPGIDGSLTAIQSGSGTVTLQMHDLQGNVVATAALSESETKTLSSYNSTEFGVPVNGTPPKYAWLGALGVSTESSSSVVVQDGTTYVPLTGRPLQTQPVTPPIPQNSVKEYVSTIEPGFSNATAATAAQQVANAEQARKAQEDASRPPEEGCDGDAGPCEGEDPGDLERGGCRVWTTIHFDAFEAEVYAYGYFSCNTPVGHFELQVCVQEETSTVLYPGQVIEESAPNGKFANYGGSEGCTKGDQFSDNSKGRIKASVSCEDPARSEEYRSWVWGRTWWPHLFEYTGWAVSAVRWSGPACEPSTHGAGMQ